MSGSKISRSSVEFLSGIRRTADITPHLTNTFETTRAIAVAASGTAAVRFEGDADDRSMYLLQGIVYPYNIIACRIVGTTATGIVAQY